MTGLWRKSPRNGLVKMFHLSNILFSVTADMGWWEIFKNSLLPMITGGIKYTIPLTLTSFAAGLLLALLTAVMRLSNSSLVRAPAIAYVSAIRGTPMLLQLFIIFYGLPSI